MRGYKFKMNTALLFVLLIVVFFPYLSLGVEFDSNHYVVWPPETEAGTFYLSLTKDPNTNLYTRKGYIPALTPIAIKMNNNKSISKWFSEVKDGPRFEYLEFVSASGVEGYIKGNSVKPVSELAVKNNESVLDENYRFVVVPVHPEQEVAVHHSTSNNNLIKIHSFSRSALDFVVTDGEVLYIEKGKYEQRPYVSVKFFQPLADGTFKIRNGWIDYTENNRRFELFDVKNSILHCITPKEDVSYLEKIKGIWEYWINDYDDNKLERAMKKTCDSEVDITFNIKAGGEIPVYMVKLEGGAEGLVKYQFPKGYRYASDTYVDQGTGKDIRMLKTIKCKPNTTSDWYAERVVFSGVFGSEEGLEIFQDDILSMLKEYFETPVAAGKIQNREKMIRVKHRIGDSQKDYFSAFYLLYKFIGEEVLGNTDFDNTERLRLKSFIAEQLVEYR